MDKVELTACFSEDDIESQVGTYQDYDDTWFIVDKNIQNIHVTRDDGSTIAILKRNMISRELCNLAVSSYLSVGQTVSSNRGHAAGLQQRSKTHTRFEKGKNANSGIIGYIDNQNLSRPCRMTQFTKDHFKLYAQGVPFIMRIDECFNEVLPDVHAIQLTQASSTPFHINGTAFSTVTVNYNFRTAIHKDSGDFKKGFGNLVVCQDGVAGGLLLFPRYKLAIQLLTGDFLAMDVHEYHCNSPIEVLRPSGYRLSFVCYLRERMVKCNEVNKIISDMGGGQKKSEHWIKEIFGCFGEVVPDKEVTSVSSSGHEWWEMKGERIRVVYKNKRYTLIDSLTSTKVHELSNAWKYAMDASKRMQSQSQVAGG